MESSGWAQAADVPGVGNVVKSFVAFILIRPRARRWLVDVQNTARVVV